MASQVKRLTAAGQVYTGSARLKSIHLTHTAAAGIVDVTDATAAGGTVLITIRCTADTTARWSSADKEGVYFGAGIRLEAVAGVAIFEFDPID